MGVLGPITEYLKDLEKRFSGTEHHLRVIDIPRFFHSRLIGLVNI